MLEPSLPIGCTSQTIALTKLSIELHPQEFSQLEREHLKVYNILCLAQVPIVWRIQQFFSTYEEQLRVTDCDYLMFKRVYPNYLDTELGLSIATANLDLSISATHVKIKVREFAQSALVTKLLEGFESTPSNYYRLSDAKKLELFEQRFAPYLLPEFNHNPLQTVYRVESNLVWTQTLDANSKLTIVYAR